MKSTGRKYRKRRGGKSRRVKSKQLQKIIAVGHVFSPMCVFCKNMSAEWEKLKVTMKTPPYKHITLEDIGDNQGENIQDLNEKYNIQLESLGYPTIFKIIESTNNQNSVEIYSGERTESKMLRWLTHRQ